MATEKLTREDCLYLLTEKQKELKDNGLARFPQRSDFTDYEEFFFVFEVVNGAHISTHLTVDDDL